MVFKVKIFRYLLAFSCLLLIVAPLARCVPEKKVGEAKKISPLVWLDDENLIVAKGGSVFLRKENGHLDQVFSLKDADINDPELKIHFFSSCFSKHLWQLRIWRYKRGSHSAIGLLTVEVHNDESGLNFKAGTLQKGVSHHIDDECQYHADLPKKPKNVKIEDRRVKALYLRNKIYPAWSPYVFSESISDKAYYVNDGPNQIILNYKSGKVRAINLPTVLKNDADTYSFELKIRQDSVTGNYFIFHSKCRYYDSTTCPRMGWWLDQNLNVVQTVRFPDVNLIHTLPSLSCFSCGCSCYTNNDIYVFNGEVYAHVWGFPILRWKRGIYKLDKSNDEYIWEQIRRGRIEAPLAISPSGCQVAYYEVGLLNEGFQIDKICD